MLKELCDQLKFTLKLHKKKKNLGKTFADVNEPPPESIKQLDYL